ncbi:MAG: hypothetical protein AAGE01_04505 [Pseudomonadota bacterium]
MTAGGKKPLGRYFAEFIVVFIGVALAFTVENLREDMNDRAVGDQYLAGFAEDLRADLVMLDEQLELRRDQLKRARIVLEYYSGMSVGPQQFFSAYYPMLVSHDTLPNRNTMDEVLSSGSLRLIGDPEIRSGLLGLYASYDRIARQEAHMARDFDVYLYDPTFSSVRFQLEGPWDDSPENQAAVQALLSDLRVENGVRLIPANLELAGEGLLPELERARAQVEQLLALLPADP